MEPGSAGWKSITLTTDSQRLLPQT